MHDRSGKILAVGDKVNVPCVIKQISATDDFCNVTLETVYGRRPDDHKETISAINTGVVEKID